MKKVTGFLWPREVLILCIYLLFFFNNNNFNKTIETSRGFRKPVTFESKKRCQLKI